MALSLYAVNEGALDDVPVEKVVSFEGALHAHLRNSDKALLETLNTGGYDADIEAGMKKCVAAFKQGYAG